MNRKSYVIVAALVGGLLLGIVFGPTLRGSSVHAQTASPSASPAPAQTTAPAGNPLRSLFLDKLAAALNIQRSALDSAITNAGTSTADAAVQQGTLTQAQADALKARIQAGDVGALWGGRGGRGGPLGGAHLPGVKQAMLDAAAQTLGITADQLTTELRSGQTLAQVAQAHATTEQAVVSAALAAAKTQLDQAVTGGTLTQAQADAAYSELQARGSNLLFGGRGGERHGGRHGGEGAPTTPQPSPAATAAPGA